MMEDRLYESLHLAAMICPQYESDLNVNLTLDWSTIPQNFTLELPTTLCEAIDLFYDSLSLNDFLGYVTYVIVPLGLISCVLSLIVLSNRQCRDVGFFYHRAINVADCFWSLFALELYLYNSFPEYAETNRAWNEFRNLFGLGFYNCFSDFVELIIAWMSVERAACYFPTVFAKINRKPVAYLVSSTLFAFSLAIVLPLQFQLQGVYAPAEQKYLTVVSKFGASSEFRTYQLIYNTIVVVRMGAVVSGSFATLVVLLLIGRRKRQMADAVDRRSQTGSNLLRQVKTNQLFCVLQLCEAIPVVIRCVLVAAMQSLVLTIDLTELVNLPFADAHSRAVTLRMKLYMFCTRKVMELLSHSLHFLLYLLCVKKIRLVAKSALFRKPASFTTNVVPK